MGWARLLFSSPLLSSRLSPLPLSNDSVLCARLCLPGSPSSTLPHLAAAAFHLGSVGLGVVNNSDQDYSHLPELDLSVMLNQGTLHQSQDQLLINHTSPVSSMFMVARTEDYGRDFHRS
uniref:Uncharacterized protein n=1 Tax=Oryza rufipogon TaxID=4529 RepID=A0A0E0NPC9_ORYRU